MKKNVNLPVEGRSEPIKVLCSHDELTYLTDLKEHPKNPNTHPQRQIDIFKKIIRYNGIRRPVTVSMRSGFVTKGHGLLETLRQMGVSKAPVDYQDYLTEHEELADMAADNKLAELSETNDTVLKELVVELDNGAFDLEIMGLDMVKIEKLMGTENAIPPQFAPPPGHPADLSGPPMFEERLGGRAFEAPSLPNAAGPVSHVRMVQLYLNESNINEFMDIVEMMEKEFETVNTTDTVLETLRWARQAISEKGSK